MTTKENQQKNCNKIGREYFNVSSFTSETRDLLLKPENGNTNELLLLKKFPNTLNKEKNYLESILNDLKFSYEVAAERCSYLLPYDEKFYESVYNFPRTVKKIKKRKCYSDKHFCHSMSNVTEYIPLPPVGKPELFLIKSQEKGLNNKIICQDPIEVVATEKELHQSRRHWDEYILSLMSQNTAQYLAYNLTKDENQADRLQRLVNNWYGPPSSFRELIPDDSADKDPEEVRSDLKSIFPYKYYMDKIKSADKLPVEPVKPFQVQPTLKTRICNLVNKEDNLHSATDQNDPYGDDTKASFYRLPVLVRKTKKTNKEVNIESVNPTTRSLKEFQLPKTPPKSVNSKLGNKVLKTDNQYQKDLYFNEKKNQKKLLNKPDNIINFDGKIYVKNLQPIWPCQITSTRFSTEDVDDSQLLETGITKGQNRWTQLPNKQEEDLMKADNALELENLERQNSRKRARDHSSLNLLVDQWRKKWQLTQKYVDSTVDELLRDMADVHPTIRLQAIVTAAKAATIIHNQKYGQTNTVQETVNSDCLPPILVNAIEILLEDPHFQVRKAAAIALHSLEKSTDKSLNILKELLISDSNIDRWAAVQCLAVSSSADSFVIGELIDQLMNSEDILVHEKASYLLAKVSYHSKLVHGMLGEKLNAISWRQRLIICKTISLLHGPLNKDLMRKVIYLMWHDPHKQVKIAASQVLGKTGNGKAVHEELITKLQSDSELIRADALEKIGILKVMTTRIMPAFLKCFHDEFVLVRKEVCRACYYLKIQDTICVENLLQLARYDPLWKVKFYAIKALSKAQTCISEIRSCILWALQFESKVQLRLVALQVIGTMPTLDTEIVDIIKSRCLVESDKSILRTLHKILNRVNINPVVDINTVAEIKEEVRKFFSNKDHIINVILTNEAIEDYNFLKETLIGTSNQFKQFKQFNENSEELQTVSEFSDSESEDNSTNEDSEQLNRDLALSPRKSQIDEAIVETEEKHVNSKVNSTKDDIDIISDIVKEDLTNSPVAMPNNNAFGEEILETQKFIDNETVINDSGGIIKETKRLSSVSNDLINDPGSIDTNRGFDIENGEFSDELDMIETEDGSKEIKISTKEFEIDRGKPVESETIKNENESEKLEKEENFNKSKNIEIHDKSKEIKCDSNESEIDKEKYPEDPETLEMINESEENPASRIKWSFILPCDVSHIKVVDHENSMMKTDYNLFKGEVKIDLLEAMINPDIRKLVDEAVQEEGLDFGNL